MSRVKTQTEIIASLELRLKGMEADITGMNTVIRIQDDSLRNIIYHSLKSEMGQKWIQSHAKGVAARHITLEEIAKFPIKVINGI